jgi:3-oxoacyl-[acyl-carrier-protein] synthase II
MQDDPIVVTGMGAVTPLGVGVETVWQRLLAGKSGIVKNDRFDVSIYQCQIAGLIPTKETDPEHGFDPLDVAEAKDLKKMDLFIWYCLAATEQALQQAGWVADDDEKRDVTATVIGSGIGGIVAMTRAGKLIWEGKHRRLSPFTVPSFLVNMAAGWVSMRYDFAGPIGAPVSACAASAQAIGDAMRLIYTGEAEVVVCGGAEGAIEEGAVGGFGAARALSTRYNDAPETASRPFDKTRDGFVLSEGSAMLVIERMSHARARGAKPLAILAGYGTTADAHHMTASPEDGAGAQAAIRRALKSAGMQPEDIDYVNAHSTSTPVGDSAEINALRGVFLEQGEALGVSSTKSSTGHMLGSAGAIEAIFSIMALRDQVMPPTINLTDPDDSAMVFDMVRGGPKKKKLRNVLSNAFAFGGVNASLVISAVDQD